MKKTLISLGTFKQDDIFYDANLKKIFSSPSNPKKLRGYSIHIAATLLSLPMINWLNKHFISLQMVGNILVALVFCLITLYFTEQYVIKLYDNIEVREHFFSSLDYEEFLTQENKNSKIVVILWQCLIFLTVFLLLLFIITAVFTFLFLGILMLFATSLLTYSNVLERYRIIKQLNKELSNN
ncbi:hypothetical protein [Streptococcus sp. CSL10205-OR2]|uniref:hypothetical protein n=1 Tax=Streptococcus sp. CSL10205-OR2 TaxID=2980558 RepID=UPI0021DB0135|nr:hypothetical protein [Streptococcus sp. CSL10205-OR2]MCU9534159.1 hypothetical protein [Streptococcus sp. CSL10205-OR2]